MASRFTLVIICLIILVFLYTFLPNVAGGIARDDDVYIMAFRQDTGPLSGFYSTQAPYQERYAPILYSNEWVARQVVGLNYAGRQILQLLSYALLLSGLYIILFRLSHSPLLTASLVLAYAIHPFIDELVTWVSAPVAFPTLLIVLLFYMMTQDLFRLEQQWLFYALILLLIFLSELALILPPLFILYALYRRYTGSLSWKKAIRLIACMMLIGTCYMLVRRLVLGEAVRGGGSGGMFSTFYESPQEALSGWKLYGFYLYNIIAAIMSNFVPIFDMVGLINKISVMTFGYWLILLGFIALTSHNWYKASQSFRFGSVVLGVWSLSPVIILLSTLTQVPDSFRDVIHHIFSSLFVAWLLIGVLTSVPVCIATFRQKSPVLIATLVLLATVAVVTDFVLDHSEKGYISLEYIQIDLYSILSIILLYTLNRQWRYLSKEQQFYILLVLAFIMLNGFLMFAYFRQRSRSVSLIGWLLIYAIVFRKEYAVANQLQATVVIAILTLFVFIGVVQERNNLPIYPYGSTAQLCSVHIERDAALRIAKENHIDSSCILSP